MKGLWVLSFLFVIFDSHENNIRVNTRTRAGATKNYRLEIINTNIESIADTIYHKRKYRFVTLHLKLTNLSNQNLSYSTMSCSWEENFAVENIWLDIIGHPCEKNVPVIKTLSPHQIVEYNLPVMFLAKLSAGKYPFRVFMDMNYNPWFQSGNKGSVAYFKKKATDLVWSNEARIVVK